MLPFSQRKKSEHKRQNMDEFDGRVLICFWRLMYLLLSQQTITQRFYGYEFPFVSLLHPETARTKQKNATQFTQLNTTTPR